MEQSNSHKKVVLATRFSALGDVAMTIPALYDACRFNADTTVVILIPKSMTELYVNHPDNLIIEGFDTDEYNGISGIWRLLSTMQKRYRPTVYVDLQDNFKTKIMRLAAHMHNLKTVHIQKGLMEKKKLTRRSGKIMLPLPHSIDRYRAALTAAGLNSEKHFTGLFESTLPEQSLYAQITQPKKTGETWIGIAPFAKHEGKIYPIGLMEQVLRELSGRHDTSVFLFGGGPYERKILGEWARKYPSTTSLAQERYGFTVELALLHDLDVMISMDSANMHLAALSGTPVVAIWGATHPYCGFGGWKVPEENNVQLPIPCRPCSVFGNKPCATGDLRCLSGLRPDVITARVDSILKQRK